MDAPLETDADDRETWITVKLAGGRTYQYWGDPEEPIDWEQFDFDPDEQDELDHDPNPLTPDELDELHDFLAAKELKYQDEGTGPPPDDHWAEAPEKPGGQYQARPAVPKALPSAKPAVKPTASLAVRMADIQPEPVEWLWEPYIPKGKLTSIEGDPGVGKSWLTMALTAQISRGDKLPGVKHAVGPAPILLLTAEDGAADTIRPRLDAASADVKKVHAITGPVQFDKAGAATLKREIEAVRPALVIIDPIVAYLPDKTDMNSASAVRPILARLAKVAEETEVAITFVRHLAKGTRDKAIYRGLGSIDFTAACRSVLMVGFDPNDSDKRVVAHGKSNLAAPGPSLAYTLKGGRFAWAGRSSLSAEDLGGPTPRC